MDLDTSFSLVSSLTPRSQSSRIHLVNSNKPSSKSLKLKEKQHLFSKHRYKVSQQKITDEKENSLPGEQLTNKNSDEILDKDCCSVNCSPNFSIDMVNVAVRKKGLDRIKPKSNTIKKRSNIGSGRSNEEIKDGTLNNKSNKALFCKSVIQSEHNLQFDMLNDFAERCEELFKDSHLTKKSSQINICCSDSPDFVDSISGEMKKVPIVCNEQPCQDLNKVKLHRKTTSLSPNISLSPAYDSDSFGKMRRRCVQVIPETSESDQSFENNSYHKNKLLPKNVVRKSNQKTYVNSNSINSGSELAMQLTSDTSKTDYSLDISSTCLNKIESHNELNEKVNSALNNKFKLKCSLENKSTLILNDVLNITRGSDVSCTKHDVQKLSCSPVLKEINIKEIHSTNAVSKEKNLKDKDVYKLNVESRKENVYKTLISPIGKNSKHKKSKQLEGSISSKTLLTPPTEDIPKFEHINNWLKYTHDKSVTPLHRPSNSSLGSSKDTVNVRPSSKPRISLSPRIKRKMKIAQGSLKEEQKLFNQIYDDDTAKRLSDDLVDCVSVKSSPDSLGASEKVLENHYVWQNDVVLPQSEKKYSSRTETPQTERLNNDSVDCVSVTSSPDSLEASEKVLEKLYGTVWQKDVVLPQSEPKRTRKKYSSKKKTPMTERKKHRTSIYEVFSSSSSEDRFEEFLENVHRGQLKSSKRDEGFESPEFINDDSDSDTNTSLVFYQQAVSSAVKDELKKFQYKDIKNNSNALKTNRRRLSFGSSKDDYSENSKSNIDCIVRGKKSPTKKNKRNSKKQKPKKKNEVNEEKDLDMNKFRLVTPLTIKNKKTSDKLYDEANRLIDVPKSVGKSKTPNSLKKHEYLNTEENSEANYLTQSDFKVPKHLTALKTPTNPIKKTVSSSPALSFLSSLSDLTAGLPCHPDALIYKKDFKNKREELTKKLFCLYNKEIFENKLPADLLIEWNTRMTSTSGYCYNKRLYSKNQVFRSSRIVLSIKILDRADRLRDTLIHELCHAATWIVDATSDGHGPKWKAWADRANRRFPELPVIKRCHDYAISTKFTYKCMSCGYCIGRHSKSLNIDRKRCGYCYGKFQMFVTSKMLKTGSDSVKTQRNPSGFALFVKENYATLKKENNVPHGEIMKLLSKKFAEVKISKQDESEPVTHL